jgi:hypothetical protein
MQPRVLGPGDPPPTAQDAAYAYDYRCTARISGLHDLRYVPRAFRLGRFIDVAAGRASATAGIRPEHFTGTTLVIGPTTKGKTTSIIAPWIATSLRNGWSCIAIDVKGDLVNAVTKAAGGELEGGRARTVVLDSGSPNVSWRWLSELTRDGGVEAAVGALLGRTPPPQMPDPALYHRDVRLLRTLLGSVVGVADMTTEHLIAALSTQAGLRAHISAIGYDGGPLVELLEFDDAADFSRRTEAILAALDGVRGAEQRRHDLPRFELADAFASPTFVCVTSPLGEEPRSTAFASLVVSLALKIGFGRFGTSGGPVLLAIDEAARMGGRINLEEVTSVGAGAGLRTLLAIQDVAQFASAGLPPSAAGTIVSNADTMLVMGGSSHASARAFAERLGMVDAPFQDRSIGNQASFFPTSSTNTRLVQRPALGDREICAPPFTGRVAVVHARQLAPLPFLVDLERKDLHPTAI